MTEPNITEIPEIPNEIISASEKGELVLFIGAGASRLIGCSGWSELAKKLINVCCDLEIINYKAKVRLEMLTDHRKVISICYTLLNEKKFGDVFVTFMKSALLYDKDPDQPNIYTYVTKFQGVFVTTNADEHLDPFFGERIIFDLENFKGEPQCDYLYHLHGSIKFPEKMVFRLTRYFEQYNNPNYQDFLNKLKSKTILFLGYGLSEFELLEYFFKNGNAKEKKYFLLNGYFGGEDDYLKFEQVYYDEMGIIIKPYLMDQKGFSQLTEVVKSWSEEIENRSLILTQQLNEIDEVLGLTE